MIIHEECLEGNFASIERLRQSAPQIAAASHQMQVLCWFILSPLFPFSQYVASISKFLLSLLQF